MMRRMKRTRMIQPNRLRGDLEDFLRPGSSELQGEELLCHKYLLPANSNLRQEPLRPSSRRNQTSVLSDNPLSRPITPRMFRSQTE